MENSKYLGVTINNKLNWTQHITNIKLSKAKPVGPWAFYRETSVDANQMLSQPSIPPW
jgi:hypothetical protein